MKPLQYWIDVSECVCNANRPIGGCLRCDLEEFQKRYDKALDWLKRYAEHDSVVKFDDLSFELDPLIKELEEVK